MTFHKNDLASEESGVRSYATILFLESFLTPNSTLLSEVEILFGGYSLYSANIL